jgi:hypothetical protein
MAIVAEPPIKADKDNDYGEEDGVPRKLVWLLVAWPSYAEVVSSAAQAGYRDEEELRLVEGR